MIAIRSSTPQPFFEAQSASQTGSRRLILLSPHFPPGQAAGALRWQKLARFAAENGWGMDVMTLDPSDLSQPADEGRLADLPPGVRIYGIPRPTFWFQWLEGALVALKARLVSREGEGKRAATLQAPAGNPGGSSELSGWPRAREDWARRYRVTKAYALERAWARAAAGTAERILDPDRHRLVVSCGPPHMTHEGGRLLANRCRLPLVVDMRDPWRLADTLSPELEGSAWRRLAARYETRVVSSASLVVMNTPPARDAMRRTYPNSAERIISVLNGWDEDPIPETNREHRFVVAFLGTIYLDRDPRPFFQAAGRVVRELGLSADDFAIEFLGHVEAYGDVPTSQLAAAEGLEHHFRARPHVPREEAIELQAHATLLLNLPQSHHKAIPSKIYDYMRFPAWLLSLSEPESATAWLLREAGADVVSPNDLDAIAEALRARVLQHQRGERPSPLMEPRFSRRAQAHRLFQAIERAIS